MTKHTRRFALLASLALSSVALAADWPQWRGPDQNGTSRETGLIEKWDPDAKENLVWKNDVGGMSSPIVMNGKVFTQTRTGEVKAGGNLISGPQTQESLIAIDAATGKPLWEYRKSPTQTEVPFHRLGWSGPAGDPAANRVYALFADCTLTCADANTGAVVWQRQMTEEFGMISTYGGRTPNPAIDEDMMFIGGVFFGWGDNARGQYRVFAFDKATGELRWTTPTGGAPVDAPYNTPVFADINGQRQVIIGAGDGGVHGFQSRTGKKLWSYQASKRGINASVLVEGSKVFIFHSEENVEAPRMGAAICIDVSGEKPKVEWLKEGVEVGFSTPTMADGRIYVLDNAATLIALDPKDGKQLWKKKMGTIGKASLVHADGKLFVPEANGRFSIVKPTDKTATVLSKVELGDKLGREYAMYGSVAIANGRIYLPTATAMYCIGSPDAKPVAGASTTPPPQQPKPEPADGKVAWVQVRPADAVMRPGQKLQFRAVAFDDKGREIGEVKDAKWSVGTLLAAPPPPNPPGKAEPIGNLKGEVDPAGNYTAAGDVHQGGAIVAAAGDVKGVGRVRVLPPLPWKFDFEDAPVDRPPLTWLGAGGKFHVKDDNGNKVLAKLTWFDLYYRANTFFGSVDMTNYTVKADVKAGVKVINDQKQVPDPAVMNNRYYLILYGNHQQLQLNVWSTELPKSLNKTIDFKWDPEKWYSMKLRVENRENKAFIYGKVWEKGQPEPEKWTIEMVDTLPNRNGNPGVFGHSLVAAAKSEIYYDNVEVTENK